MKTRAALVAVVISLLCGFIAPVPALSDNQFLCQSGTNQAIVDACGARWEAANIRAHVAANDLRGSAPSCLNATSTLLERLADKWLAENKSTPMTEPWPCGIEPAVAKLDDGALAQACPNAVWSYDNKGASGCNGAGPASPPPPAYVPPPQPPQFQGSVSGVLGGLQGGFYTIPVILPLTGAGAFLGQKFQTTIHAVEAITNAGGGIGGHSVKFAIFDDQSNPAVDVQIASQVSRSPIVLGPTFTASCLAVAPVLASGPVDWCLSPAVQPPAGAYNFVTGVSTYDQMIATVRFLREKGLTRVAVLATTDATGQSTETFLNQALQSSAERSVSLVAAEHFSFSDVSVAAQLARITAANPQVLIVTAIGPPFGTVLHGMRDAGLNLPVVGTSGNVSAQQLASYGTFLPTALYFPAAPYVVGIAQDASVKHSQDAYSAAMQRAGVTPDLVTGLPWDPATIAVDVLRRLGTDATPAQVRDYIGHLHGYAGILGMYDFNAVPQRGVGADSVVMVQWNGSGFTAASSFGGGLR